MKPSTNCTHQSCECVREELARLRKTLDAVNTVGAAHITTVANLLTENDRLREALEESVELQSHYAGLLNIYDQGKRMVFKDADAWLTRLAALEGK